MKAWIAALAMTMAFAGAEAEAKKPPPPESGQIGGQTAPDGVVFCETTDAEMNPAIAQARRWIPAFLADFRQSPAYNRQPYSLRLWHVTPFGGSEHIWVDNLRYEGAQLAGSLANQPVEFTGMSLGSRVVIDEAIISDWMMVRGGLAYGGSTMRVMPDKLPREDADALCAFLAKDPAPPDWRP